MRDDLIQGIVFSRSEVVDLRRLSRRERMIFKMLATKNSLRNLSAPSLKKTSAPVQRDFVAIRSGSNRQQDLTQLQARLKHF